MELPDRLLLFYFHRNIVGTFFTICSWYREEGYSEINTLVRLGNGYSSATGSDYDPVSIEPFVITLRTSDGEVTNVEFQDNTLIVGGDVVQLTQLQQEENECRDLSDQFLRRNYWYYLNRAEMLSNTVISTNIRNYAVLTYSNIVGTFLVITSCEDGIVRANTFVRLGRGSENSNNSIIFDPIVLPVPQQ